MLQVCFDISREVGREEKYLKRLRMMFSSELQETLEKCFLFTMDSHVQQYDLSVQHCCQLHPARSVHTVRRSMARFGGNVTGLFVLRKKSIQTFI